MCLNCGFTYLNRDKNATALEEFYDQHYVQNRNRVFNFETAIKRLERKGSYENKQKYVSEIAPFVKKGMRVLEIGSGYGTLLRVLADKTGVISEGIEPGELGAEVAVKHYKLDVKHTTLEKELANNMERYRGRYDAVLMVHVLEHLEDPLKKLKAIKTFLKEPGIIYIAVPNLSLPDLPFERFFHIEHLSYFTPATLSKILKNAGFTPIRCLEKPNELVMVGAVGRTDFPPLSFERFSQNHTPKRVLARLVRHDRKYQVLRALRSPLSTILSSNSQKALSAKLGAVLRALNII
jgi:2-polyprenyl-3-methyl-5-hydroxy-6-metoxy-1,4-benzoquinol methylase